MKLKFHAVLLSGLLIGCGAGVEENSAPVMGAALTTDLRTKVAGQYLLDDSNNGVKCQTDVIYSEKGKWNQSSNRRKKSGTYSVVNTEEELDTLVKVTDKDNGLADCHGSTTAQIGEIDILFFAVANDGDLSFYSQPEQDSKPLLVLDRQISEPEAGQQLALQNVSSSSTSTTVESSATNTDSTAKTDAPASEAITVAEALEARHEVAVVNHESSEQAVQDLSLTAEIADRELAAASNRLAAATANLEAMTSVPTETENPDDSNARLEAYILERELMTTIDEEMSLAAAHAARDVNAPRLIAVQDTAEQPEVAEAKEQIAAIQAGSEATSGEPDIAGAEADYLAQQRAYELEQQQLAEQAQLDAYIVEQQKAAELKQQKLIEATLAAEKLAAASLKAEKEATEIQSAVNAIEDWTYAERTAASRTLDILLCEQCNIGQVKLKLPSTPVGEQIEGFRVYYGDATQTSSILNVGSSLDSTQAQFNFTNLATSKDTTLCFSATTFNSAIESFESAPMCILTITASS